MVRLTDRPDMTLDVYRGRKTIQQQKTTSTTWPWCLLRFSQHQFLPKFLNWEIDTKDSIFEKNDLLRVPT